MRTIRNRTMRPLRVPLHGGKMLHLGPLKEGQIADQDVDSPGVERLVAAEEIDVLGEDHGTVRTQAGSPAPADVVGHHPDTTIKKRGDR